MIRRDDGALGPQISPPKSQRNFNFENKDWMRHSKGEKI